MTFKIVSDTSRQYFLEEDAVKGFAMAVQNGQTRLGMSILVDIVQAFNEIFTEILSDEETEEVDAVESKNEKEDQIPTKTAKKESEPKTTTKKAEKTTAEK